MGDNMNGSGRVGHGKMLLGGSSPLHFRWPILNTPLGTVDKNRKKLLSYL